jgi:hypothetical protein
VVHKPCTQPGCETLAVFNHPTASTGLYCGQHKPPGFINVKVPLGAMSPWHTFMGRMQTDELDGLHAREHHRLSGGGRVVHIAALTGC